MIKKKKRQHIVVKNIVTSSLTKYERQELKYYVSNRIVDLVVAEISNFMQHDHYSQHGPYEIHSVYFDTSDWQAFYSKLDGNRHRQKFRVRSYTQNPKNNENVFLEIKEKKGGTVYKRRIPMIYKDVKQLIEDYSSEISSPVIDEWRYALIRNRIKPCLLNAYTREAFISEHYPGLRITIDRDLTYSMTNYMMFDLPLRHAYWSRDKSVIEVKFDRYVPQFVVDIILKYNFTQTPVSKYCECVISHFSDIV